MTAEIAEADSLIEDLLGPDAIYPNDEVLKRPAGSRGWDDIRRHLLLRMRVASVGAILGNLMIDATRELRQDIENELALRDRER